VSTRGQLGFCIESNRSKISFYLILGLRGNGPACAKRAGKAFAIGAAAGGGAQRISVFKEMVVACKQAAACEFHLI
jgi:hypothetical protein